MSATSPTAAIQLKEELHSPDPKRLRMDFGVIDVEAEYDAAAGSADGNAGQPLGLGIGAVQFLNDGDGDANTALEEEEEDPVHHGYSLNQWELPSVAMQVA